MAVSFCQTIRETEVLIVADKFQEDPNGGISMSPEELGAWVLNEDGSTGAAFELTVDEVELLSIKASEYFDGQDNAADMADLRDA